MTFVAQQVTRAARRIQGEHKFIILGAGLTGLSAARRLDELGEHDYLLVEQEDRPGGWAKTDLATGYGADRATHVLYFRDEGNRRLVERLLDGRWIHHRKHCVIESMGVRTPFPFHANLHGRPAELIVECLNGLLEASINQSQEAPATFLDWILRTYGPGVARHFMIPYNMKMWTVPPDQMTADWMRGFVPPVDARRAVQGALHKLDGAVGANAHFFYPEMGISALADRLASELQSPVRYGISATKIAAAGKLIHLSDGRIYSFGSIISTIPLPRLATITNDLPPHVQRTARSLRAMDLTLVDVGVRRPMDDGEHWAYLPDPDVIGYRLSAVHNLTDRLTPKGHGLYTVEIAHSSRRQSPRGGSLKRRVVADLVRLRWLRSADDVTFLRERSHPCAYALPLIGSSESAATVSRSLEDLGVLSVGRYGEWKYSNMEDALVDGREAVNRLLARSAAW